ncbi:MAG: sensor histidine kinase, partial [Candidatus Electrothrix sp. AR4]|nr:sensor histidine kinase [Candidatus Electrothrix sp. AR4]
YVLNESETGWRTAEFSEIADAIQKEVVALESVIDEHLQMHLQQLTRTEIFVNEKYRHTLVVVSLTSAAVVLLTVIVFILMTRSVLVPVKLLQEGTRQIGTGNMGHRLEINSGDEFEFLAKEFEKMAEQLSRYHENLDLKVQERTRELVHTNAELQKAEGKIRNLSQELLTVQETERQQISLYLHDNVAQNLSSLKIAGEELLQDAAGGSIPDQHEIKNWAGLLNRCIKTVRELSYNLRPPGLEQIGLVSAIGDYCRDFSKKNNIAVQFTKAGVGNLQLEFDYAINIYRLVQEALNNVRKHANARSVEIRLITSHPNIILRIEDEGCGFDPEAGYRKALENKRFGLLGMEERVRMMQGSFKIHSAPKEGTKIIVEFPDPTAAERLADNTSPKPIGDA